ncbi:MAG: AAA family ATPase, partial [Bacteroidia bacterium]
ALLKALRIAAGSFLQAIAGPPPTMSSKDHRIIGSNPLADLARECRIQTEATIIGPNHKEQTLSWEKYKLNPFEGSEIKALGKPDIQKLSGQIYDAVVEHKTGILPLLSFIGTEYIHLSPLGLPKPDLDGSALQGYWACLEERSMEDYVFSWLSHMDKLSTEKQYKSNAADFYGDLPEISLQVFNKTVSALLPDIVHTEWIQDPVIRGENAKNSKILTFKMRNGDIRTYDMLSDGYRYLVLLAGELSTRALLLNKHLGLKVCEEITGIVLIDEFGIHLHPGFQKDSLKRLSDAFPNVQFFISTHSPMLVNGLKKEQIHILEIDEESGARTHRYLEQDVIGLGAEGILLEVFGLKTTFDTETETRLKRYKTLTQKRLTSSLNEDEVKEYAQLAEQVSTIGYERSESDPLYEQLIKKIDSEHAKRPKRSISKQEADEIAKKAIESLFGENSL